MSKYSHITIHDDTRIHGFFGQYRYLSNYHLCDIYYLGQKFTSTEAAYQAAKSLDPEVWKTFSKYTPAESRKAGQLIELRADWAEAKLDVMTDVVFQKFSYYRDLRALLLNTGDKHIEETNTWGDRYWGVCDGVGENRLGKLLMNLRTFFRNNQ